MKVPCKYCQKHIDTRGMNSHVHFKHLSEVLAEFRGNPLVQFYAALSGVAPKLLKA